MVRRPAAVDDRADLVARSRLLAIDESLAGQDSSGRFGLDPAAASEEEVVDPRPAVGRDRHQLRRLRARRVARDRVSRRRPRASPSPRRPGWRRCRRRRVGARASSEAKTSRESLPLVVGATRLAAARRSSTGTSRTSRRQPPRPSRWRTPAPSSRQRSRSSLRFSAERSSPRQLLRQPASPFCPRRRRRGRRRDGRRGRPSTAIAALWVMTTVVVPSSALTRCERLEHHDAGGDVEGAGGLVAEEH